jgi:hypothetical protein
MMMKFFVFFLVCVMGACTEDNPRYCDPQKKCPDGQYCSIPNFKCYPTSSSDLAGGPALDLSSPPTPDLGGTTPQACTFKPQAGCTSGQVCLPQAGQVTETATQCVAFGTYAVRVTSPELGEANSTVECKGAPGTTLVPGRWGYNLCPPGTVEIRVTGRGNRLELRWVTATAGQLTAWSSMTSTDEAWTALPQ